MILLGITLIPSAFQKVADLPREVVTQFVALALDNLKSPCDSVRKNTAVFFENALVQPIALEIFDEAEGLKKLLRGIANSRLLIQKEVSHDVCRLERQVPPSPSINDPLTVLLRSQCNSCPTKFSKRLLQFMCG